MLRTYTVYNDKYQITGKVEIAKYVVFLSFTYDEKEISFALDHAYTRKTEEEVKAHAEAMITSYIENLHPVVLSEQPGKATKKTKPRIEAGKVLLVLSDQEEYYFHSLYYRRKGQRKKEEYDAFRHLGMHQDSFLIMGLETGIDIRYFAHFRSVELYCEETDGFAIPLYIENAGAGHLYVRCSVGLLRLEPGERKEVKKENAEHIEVLLPTGDLYPAGF